MHEVALCRGLADAVLRATGDRQVDAVHVEVGALRQVVPEAMEFAWTFVVRGTPLADAALHLRPVPAVLACDDCGSTATLGPALGFTCRACGSRATHLASGEELRLVAVDVLDDDECAAAQEGGAPWGASTAMTTGPCTTTTTTTTTTS